MIMSRRVNANAVLVDPPTPIQSVDSFLNQYRDQYVTEHSLPLRVVFPEFENGVHLECILDGGAQVIVMRKDIWEHLDLPLLTEKIMIMESANNTHNHTLGVVQNVKMTFGPITLMLQI
jgi:Aspartyl protease